MTPKVRGGVLGIAVFGGFKLFFFFSGSQDDIKHAILHYHKVAIAAD